MKLITFQEKLIFRISPSGSEILSITIRKYKTLYYNYKNKIKIMFSDYQTVKKKYIIFQILTKSREKVISFN